METKLVIHCVLCGRLRAPRPFTNACAECTRDMESGWPDDPELRDPRFLEGRMR